MPLITNADLLDRIKIQGLFDKHFSGGAIAHLSLGERIEDVEKMERLIRYSAKQGVIYFAINYVLHQCVNDHMSVGGSNVEKCPICGEPIKDSYTRIVGYLVRVDAFNKVRREIDYPNRKFYTKEDNEQLSHLEAVNY